MEGYELQRAITAFGMVGIIQNDGVNATQGWIQGVVGVS